MTRSSPPGEPLAAGQASEPSALTFRSGSELADLAESLYLRLFVLVLGCLPLACALAVVAALVRTHNADLVRTTALAVGLAGLAALALHAPARGYRAIRRRPWLSLSPALLALAALTIDGVTHSPLSFAAAVTVAIPALVCGPGWAVAAATLISVGVVSAATLRYGFGVLDAVAQGTAGYFVWALVWAALAERFAHLAMQLPPAAPAPPPPAGGAPPTSIAMRNRDSDRPPIAPETAAHGRAPTPAAAPTAAARLTARQLQVLALLADGLRADEIAQRLGITTTTVYRHVERAKQRAELTSRSELVAVVIRDGMLHRTSAE